MGTKTPRKSTPKAAAEPVVRRALVRSDTVLARLRERAEQSAPPVQVEAIEHDPDINRIVPVEGC